MILKILAAALAILLALSAAAECLPAPIRSVVASSEEVAMENGAAANAVDGNLTTNWVTRWSTDQDIGQHTLTLQLQSVSQVCGLRVTSRADGDGGRIGDYVIWTSEDCGALQGVAQGDPMHDGGRGDVAEFMWPARAALCVKIGSNRDTSGGQFASAAEVEVLTEQVTQERGTITIRWDPVSHPNLGGYRVYRGTSSRSYDWQRDVGLATRAVVDGLDPKLTYYLAVKSVHTDGVQVSSEFSNEVSGLPKTPPGPLVSPLEVEIEE